MLDDDVLAGFAGVIHGKIAQLGPWYVTTDRQSRGIGKVMTQKVIEYCHV